MEKPQLSDVLAQKRTALSAKRTIMSAERSLMAWIRTGLTMIGFGFTIFAFLQSLLESKAALKLSMAAPRRIGLFLIGIGVLSLVFGSIEYWGTVKSFGKEYGYSPWRFPLLMAVLICALGVFLFVAIILNMPLI